MPGRDILLIGASAGGVQALSDIVTQLPQDLPAAVFVVMHISPSGTSAMPAILSRAGRLPAVHPKDGEPILPGRIYVAPPDHHLVVEPGHVRLSRAPTENGHRPAVDVLFRTAAHVYRERTVGVVLTGNLDDGTAGLATLKRLGGTAIVQDPEEADYPGMPLSALRAVAVDHVLPLLEIGPLLDRLARKPVEPPESALAQGDGDMKDKLEWGDDREKGEFASGLTCPECGGALFEQSQLGIVHFRCRTGHAYSPESLLAEQGDALEASLWAAVRALEENAALARRMEKWMNQRGRSPAGEERYGRRAAEAERHADALRRLLLEDEPVKAEEPVKTAG